MPLFLDETQGGGGIMECDCLTRDVTCLRHQHPTAHKVNGTYSSWPYQGEGECRALTTLVRCLGVLGEFRWWWWRWWRWWRGDIWYHERRAVHPVSSALRERYESEYKSVLACRRLSYTSAMRRMSLFTNHCVAGLFGNGTREGERSSISDSSSSKSAIEWGKCFSCYVYILS